MEYRILGSTGLSVSVIALGTWSMGGRWWGDTDDENAVTTIHKALDLGVNLIDTADVYGFGHSEELIGTALSGKREEVIIASKVGLRWNNKGKIRNDLSRSHIFNAVDASLARLKTDYIDLYQVHWPDPNTSVEETMTALNECVEAGKVRYIGASNLSVEQIQEYRKYGSVETLQPPLNLFEREAEVQLLPHCLQESMGVLIYSPLCKGLLSGKFKAGDELNESIRKNDRFFQEPAFGRNLRIVDKLKQFADEKGRTIAQLALSWVLAHSAVTVALSGARRPEQIAESVGSADWQLNQDDLQKIDRILTLT